MFCKNKWNIDAVWPRLVQWTAVGVVNGRCHRFVSVGFLFVTGRLEEPSLFVAVDAFRCFVVVGISG
jgi:hypothetical protein